MKHPYDRKVELLHTSLMLSWHERGGCRQMITINVNAVPVMVPCRQCFRCLRRKRQMNVGRAVAEAYTRPGSQCLTLTYADEHLPSLTVANVEREIEGFRHRLKRAYPGAKYLIVWQLGTQTDRLHAHALIFPAPGQILPTPKPTDGKYMPADGWLSEETGNWVQRGLWPRGHRLVDDVTPGSAGYALSYMNNKGKGTLKMSKSPHLGEEYFRHWLTLPPLPQMIPGSFYVKVDETPIWFPLSMRFKEIADEYGYEWRNQEQSETYRQFIEKEGPALRAIDDWKDKAKRAQIERMPERPRESQAVIHLKAQMEAARKARR